MATTETPLKVEKFEGLSELPLYQQPRGKLKTCQNLRVTPDGLLEARGGLEKLQPSGGTATAPIAGGFYTGAHEHNCPVAWIFRFNGVATYTNNLALQAYIDIFSGTAVGNRIYFISPKKFSRILFNIGTAGVGGYTILWRYLDTGGAAQALAGVTEDFKTLGARTVSFSPPATWGLNSVNNVYGYVIYAEVATAVIGTMPTQSTQRIHVDWQGMKQIYLGSSDNASGTANGTIKLYGQNGATANWLTVTSSLTSTSDPKIRFASWRGYLYWLNGIEQQRYNLDSVATMGFTAPGGALTTALGGTGLTGLFKYYVTLGYGAAGELGESDAFGQTDTVRAPVNQQVTITLSGLTGVPAKGTADVIYVYRSVDLSTVALASSYGAFPAYRIATVTRDANGAFPATYVDSVMAIPVPVKTMVPVTNVPPSRCQFIAVHRSRVFLARNDQYPGRVWWSKNFESESFNQDEDFADFTRSTSGAVTGMVEFADQIVVFTEDAMYGIANVDQDVPNVYIIAAGIGCISDESLRSGYGLLLWAARGGIYIWDGTNPPTRVSDDLAISMGRLSVESHGGSRAIIYDRMYEIEFITQDNVVTSMSRYRYDLATKAWSTLSLTTSDSSIGPLMTFTAPLGHEDFGNRHPLYGKVQATGSLFHVYVGEWKTVDDGNAINYIADMHLGPSGGKAIVPKRAIVVYRNQTGGWTTPVAMTLPNAANVIGDQPTIGTVFTDGAADYTISQAPITGLPAYTADVVLRFQATSLAGGTANRQHLIAAYMDGNMVDQPSRTN
jgi:hypothetical protein